MFGTVLQVLGFLLSIAAFAVSLRAFRRGGPLTDLQTRIATLELAAKKRIAESQARADVRAVLLDVGNHAYRLVFENRGAARALNVDIEFADPVHETMFPSDERGRHLPIAELDPHDQVPVLVALASGRWPPFDMTLVWTDSDGTEQRKAGKLRFLV